MCGPCKCTWCQGCWQKIKPRLGVNGLDPADPNSGFKLAKRMVIYVGLVIFVLFHMVCLVLFFGVAGGVQGGKWYILFLPYQMFLIVLFVGLGTVHMTQKAGVPCPMRVRGFVLYGAPQNSIHAMTTVQQQQALGKVAAATKAQETQTQTPVVEPTVPATMVWTTEVKKP